MLTTIVVTNPTDATVAAELSLRQAVAQANLDAAAGISDTITFDPSLGGQTVNLTQGQLELSGAGAGTITIDGNTLSSPLTIDAQSESRIFQIDSGVSAVLTNLNLEYGDVNSGASGGGILNSGTLTVSNSSIYACASYQGSGGAIESSGPLTLDNDIFTSNSANDYGGAVDNKGSSLVVNDCTFNNYNRAYISGGAISVQNGTLTVNGSTFSGNAANTSGGAIEVVAGTATLDDDIFSSNAANTSGSAIDNQGTLTLTGGLFTSDNTDGVGGGLNNGGIASLAGSTFTNDNAGKTGGGIENASGGTLTVSGSTFTGNESDYYGSGGGGIENAGMATVVDSTITGSYSYQAGGGIQNASGGTLTVSDSTISGNSAADSGGGIDNSGTLTLQNSIVAGNSSSNSTNPDINGAITTDNGNNLLGTGVNNSTNDPTPGPGDVFSNTPMLTALGNYGGPTQTMSLLAGSPAIGAGNASATSLPTTDQRGLPRTAGGKLDIGAFQTQLPAIALNTLSQTTVAGQPTGAISIELQDPDGNPTSAGSVTYSANGTTADTTGSTNLTLVNGAGYAAGQTGQALSLNGVNQYAITPNLASLFASSNANVTISLWFNAAGAGVIVDELGQTTLSTGWNDSQIEILANGTVEVRVWDLPAVTLGTASFNAWHNVVLRYNAASQTLDGFLDGVQSTSVSNGARQTPYGSGYGLYYAFGAADTNNLGSGSYFDGLIQNISIFTTALPNAQVASLFAAGNSTPAPLTVTLSSSSPGGSFSYPDGLPINGGQVIVPLGASSITVDYTDTVPGTPVLSVSAPGFASASQQETILPCRTPPRPRPISSSAAPFPPISPAKSRTTRRRSPTRFITSRPIPRPACC